VSGLVERTQHQETAPHRHRPSAGERVRERRREREAGLRSGEAALRPQEWTAGTTDQGIAPVAPAAPAPAIPVTNAAPATAAAPVADAAPAHRRLARRAYMPVKRLVDVAGAGVLLVALAPVLVVITLAILLDSGRPILYGARRVGRHGQPIQVLKFRTMHRDAERRLSQVLRDPARAEEFRTTFKLKQDPRISRIGGWLRRTSLDELPQFWNVLRGDMSLVGPRPIVEDELDMYRNVEGGAAAYLGSRPGITGLWQVSGRNDTTYAERIELDCHYAEHCSLALDLEILTRTPGAVLKGDGAY
jgi:lipopolysaccharide/colanic/teichoic acid biosynthesis glycosyltransferase